ncbi:YbaN family protein [Candidatus Borrarchaeum sp.]|uniref:YbaN family protein n=1 Tax=Candidatus Borrarchaeum sp. TaxID=2846742 RepID=UPI00257DE48B|nr:YbaN family protein [Candidatus Borrarchaeum sp.]
MDKSEEKDINDANITITFRQKLFKGALVVTGTLSLALGIIGIFIPLLPTTPFLLLAAYCYARSSKKLYNWLISNKWFGSYIRNYYEGKGIPLKAKLLSITFLWLTIGFSTYFIVNDLIVRIILVIIAIGVTIHILTIKTLKEERFEADKDN